MLLAQIRASMRAKRRKEDKLVPGGGWARSTLQEVGRRNWIPAKSKWQHLERTDMDIKHEALSQPSVSHTLKSKRWSFTDLVWETKKGRRETQKSCFYHCCNVLKNSGILVSCRFCVTKEDLCVEIAKYPTFNGSAMNQQLLCFCLKVQMGNVLRPLFFTTLVSFS